MNMTSFSSQHDKHESSYINNSAILSALGFGALGVLLFLLFRRRHSNSEDLCARPLEAKGKGAKSVERGGKVKRRGKGKKVSRLATGMRQGKRILVWARLTLDASPCGCGSCRGGGGRSRMPCRTFHRILNLHLLLGMGLAWGRAMRFISPFFANITLVLCRHSIS